MEQTENKPIKSPRRFVVYDCYRGVAASYALEVGEYDIGSHKSCRIRIADKRAASFHALLVVDTDGVTLRNVEKKGSLFLDGHALEAKKATPLHELEPIRLGETRMELLPADDQGWPTHLTEEAGALPIQHEASDDIRRGILGYRRFQRLMSSEISAREAQDAWRAFRKRIHVLGWVLGALLGLFIFRLSVPRVGILASEIPDVILECVCAGTLVVLGGIYNIPFVGRLMLPIFAPLLLVGAELEALFLAPPFFLLGCLFDYGISTRPDRSRPPIRRACLVSLGLLGASLSAWALSDLGPQAPAVCALAGSLGLIVWPWWPAPLIETFQRKRVTDTWLVLYSGLQRWSRHATGRLMAICLGLWPLLFLMFALEVREWIQHPGAEHAESAEAHSPAAAEPSSGLEQPSLFWVSKGRWINDRETAFYVPAAFIESGTVPELKSASEAKQHSVEVTSASLLLKPLKDFCLSNEVPRHKAAIERDAGGTAGSFYVLSTADQPPSLSVAESLLDQEGASTFLWRLLVFSVCAAAFGVLGFLFLWRRGGDSAVARWAGIWMIVLGSLGVPIFGDLFLEFLSRVCREGVNTLPAFLKQAVAGKASGEATWKLSDTVSPVLQFIQAARIPLCVLWVHLCWPNRRWNFKHRWSNSLVICGKVIVVCMALGWTA